MVLIILKFYQYEDEVGCEYDLHNRGLTCDRVEIYSDGTVEAKYKIWVRC